MSTHGTAASLFLLVAQAGLATAQERWIRVAAEEQLRIFEAGAGDAVVLVPGLLGSAFGFRKLIEPLAGQGYRVIVVEPLGIGGSGKPERADYSLTAQADRIAAALRVLEVDQAVIVAHAVGASMALRLAFRHPELVTAVVSLDGGPAEAAATPGFRRAMSFAVLIKLFGGMKRIRGTVRSTLIERSADPRWVTDEVVDGYMAAGVSDLDATLAAFREMANAREPQPLRPRLSEVRCPVRLVIGTATRAGGISEAETTLLAEGLRSFRIDRVDGAGHFVFEENPGAVVAAVNRARASARLEAMVAAGPLAVDAGPRR